MAKINVVTKKVRMGLWDVIKYQIHTHCYLKGLIISQSELECLALLGINKEAYIPEFSNAACSPNKKDRTSNGLMTKAIFESPQCVRNTLRRLEKMQLIDRKNQDRKKITLSNDVSLQTEGNIMLDHKILYIEPEKVS